MGWRGEDNPIPLPLKKMKERGVGEIFSEREAGGDIGAEEGRELMERGRKMEEKKGE